MHTLSKFKESRTQVLHDLIRARPLATFVICQDNETVVDHLPLMVCTGEGESSVLRGHIPRANPIWKSFDGKSKKALAVFQGPDSYVTPSWYPSKHPHGKAVPTWNFVVAHAHGYPLAVHDADWLLKHLNELTDWQESDRELPWQVSDAPEDYIDKMLAHIVGIEMPISELHGKWKVSQNRPQGDRLGVAAGLRRQADENSLAMESLVRQRANKSKSLK